MPYSIGEQYVAKILNENDIDYEYDFPIDGLRGVRNGILRFDFVLKKNNRNIIIEYNGIYHYHIIHGKTTMYTLSKQQMNDTIKHDYCVRKKIPILWIPYWVNNAFIKKTVQFFLLKHKFI